jgi:hypothetical protein
MSSAIAHRTHQLAPRMRSCYRSTSSSRAVSAARSMSFTLSGTATRRSSRLASVCESGTNAPEYVVVLEQLG